MSNEDKRAYEIVKKMFRNDNGEPFLMTEGQISMFRAIYERQYPRIQIETYTQYGKSDVISIAVLMRAATFPERWPILAPTGPKTKIIMEKVIKHIFENEYTKGKFRIGSDESMERIKRTRSQNRLTFKVDKAGNMGEIFVLSAEARKRTDDAGDILMGFGAPNLIEDESALIPDRVRGKIIRMLGGHKDNFLCKIGNTFTRGHFLRTHNDSHYHKIHIDCDQGIREGRITQDFVDEARRECNDDILFNILYKCQFPTEDEIDEADWIILMKEDEIRDAMKRTMVEPKGIRRLGVDVARGGRDYNVWCLRTDNIAKRIKKNKDPDLMSVANATKELLKDEHIAPEDVYIDDVGYGGGVVDRLKELGFDVNGINEASSASDKDFFANIKAEMYSNGAKWIRRGGVLEDDEALAYQLIKTRWKKNSSGRMMIKPKRLLRLDGYDSPDDLDAFMLTFAKEGKEIIEQKATSPVSAYYPELGI